MYIVCSMKIIESFEARELKKRPFVIRIADWLTSVFGSITFFLFNIAFFVYWMTSGIDPYPYTLLTTIVSLEAIFLSIIVLMSAQRQSYISTLREELDMQVNLIAEREITKILKLLKLVLEKQDKNFKDEELEEMITGTDISYIERRLQAQIEGATKSNGTLIKEIAKPIIEIEKAAEHVTHLGNGTR